jgi:hypothetical protein
MPDPKAERKVTSSGGHETISYSFHVEIFVRAPAFDEKAVRAVIDDELVKLGVAIKNVK